LLSNFSRSRIISSDLKPSEKSIDAFITDVRLWDNDLIAPVSIFEDQEIFEPDDLERYDHYFDVQFDESGRYSGNVIRYGEKVDLPTPEQQPVTREMKCGPFGFRFWYWHGEPKETMVPSDSWQRINRKLKYAGGIMVYRDGLRVLPYGVPVNDWLNIEERRSKGAKYYFFSFRRMFGYVNIDANKNPELKDKAGREGLIKNGAYRDLRSTLETFLIQMAALYFRDNPDFREQLKRIKEDNELLDSHKKALLERRKALLAELKSALSKLEKQKSRIESLRDEIESRLDAPDLSIDEMEEVVSSFEKRVQQLLGEIKVVIPKNLSLGRGRDLNQAAYDYENSFKEIREFADSARKSILTKVEKGCPSIEKRLSRRKLLETALSSGKMRVGKAFAELTGLVEGKTSRIASKINERKAETLQHVENALLQATGTTILSDAFLAEEGIEVAVNLIAQAASSAETMCTELQERYSHVLGNALSEDNALIMSVQDDRIEELEKKVQETVELAQIGLSVEMIHHDLHNMFRGISGSIRSLRHMFRHVPQAMEQVNTLQSTFQHLELRYRQLEPLYRASYRLKRIITGEEIIKFVRQFLEHDLGVVGVTLEPSEQFLAFSIIESPALIHPAFVNLVDNAIYWLRSVDRRVIRFDIVNDAIVVNDSGPGIHETLVERIFEAFTTTKENGRGLGLYIARQSLSLANHEIWATNDSEYKVEPGACFCLKFSEKARNNKDEEGDVTA
jgi:signal transduction histidine kinase